MYDSARTFVTALGGYRAVARRLGINSTTLHGYIAGGSLPSKWYGAFLTLASERNIEPPSRDLFSFEVLPPPPEPGKDAA